ncbi:p115 like vesicle tethering protein [Boletus coccyginus]|nr:p115 like vesicle tethering protein [Boletus coccyginus]
MDFLSQTYIALRGPTGAPQSPTDTIAKLSDRLSPSTLLADRRAAVLSLKGLTRDCKAEVGERALPGLIQVLQNDAEIDADIGKAVLETVHHLCEVDELSKEQGLQHTDYFLASEQPTHTLFALLADSHFYIRYPTLQLLATLLQNRRSAVQGYFLKAPKGASSIISVLEDKREIIRNESIVMIQLLISQSPDIQKVLAFEGAFEKLFNIVAQEGGVEGGVITHDTLRCVDSLLRFNASNQSYFRETPLPALLCSLLLFPPNLQLQDSPPQEFALQFWDQQKTTNVSFIIGIMGMLIGTKGNSNQETVLYVRSFVELALASNAPTPLKTQALRLLPSNLAFPLSEVILTPYMPVPETNGEEWDRLEPASALDVLVELVLHGEYNGLYGDKRLKDALELRGAALNVFDNFVRREEIKQAIVQGMLPPEGPTPSPMISPLLHALCIPPTSPLNVMNITTTHFATLLFAHLLASSPRCKALARSIKPSPPLPPSTPNRGHVPESDDDDVPQSLIPLFTENLSLVLLREVREWERLIVGYLCLLAQWLWEDPKAVRDFLEAGGLGVLVEPINQTTETESLIPGLCAFLLGLCYEFNREAWRNHTDDRFKSVTPESMVTSRTSPGVGTGPHQNPVEQEGEIWFDWAFVDFWKSNHYTVQRGLSSDPNVLSSSASSSSGPSAESAMLISSLRDVIRTQATEMDALQAQLKDLSASSSTQLEDLHARIADLEAALKEAEGTKRDVEKEQEDLLVLLDEMSTKRRRDKARMREAGLEVSEDEGEEE